MNPCPPDELLRAFENGELTASSAAPIQRHSERCPRCVKRLEEIRQMDLEGHFLREACSDPAGTARLSRETERMTVAGAPPAESQAIREWAAEAPFGSGEWPIPDYERVQLCGEGAYGSVWAVKGRVGVYRALKLLDVARINRAQVDCRESAALETYCSRVGRHPYLISVFHVGMVANVLYYTMELADNDVTKSPVDGAFPAQYRPLTLRSVIRRRRIQPDTAIEIMRRLLRGLKKLHGLDLVHRDIKPANIIFVRLRPKLADIGMVTPQDESKTVIGTPRYMPPDRVMDRTADTFAMGKVLYEMIVGEDFDSFPSLPPSLYDRSTRWDLRKIDELIQRACSHRAADRFESAGEMLENLEACSDLPIESLFFETGIGQKPQDAAETAPWKLWLLLASRALPWAAGLIALAMVLHFLRGG